MAENQGLKVAIVVCALPPQGGGIGNNAYYHAKELSRRSYQVTVFTPKYRKQVAISADGFTLEYLPVFLPIGKAGFLLSLFFKLKNFDIIHLYYPFFGTDLIVYLFKKLHQDKKLVLHYEMDPVGAGISKIIFKTYLKLFLNPLLKISDKIIVLSWDNAEHGYLKKYLIKNKNKFVAIPNGIDTNIFQPKIKNQELLAKHKISESDQVLIFAGGLDSQHFFKGVDVLLKAFAEIVKNNHQVKLMIIGDGNRKKHYQGLAEQLGVSIKVIFTGWIANEKLADYYNLGELFILPSIEKTESFGIVIAEAQACGLPAIVSNWPGSRETIENNQTGLLVEPKNIGDLTAKIHLLLTDDSLRKQMGERAAARAKEKYDWKKIVEQLSGIYRNL